MAGKPAASSASACYDSASTAYPTNLSTPTWHYTLTDGRQFDWYIPGCRAASSPGGTIYDQGLVDPSNNELPDHNARIALTNLQNNGPYGFLDSFDRTMASLSRTTGGWQLTDAGNQVVWTGSTLKLTVQGFACRDSASRTARIMAEVPGYVRGFIPTSAVQGAPIQGGGTLDTTSSTFTSNYDTHCGGVGGSPQTSNVPISDPGFGSGSTASCTGDVYYGRSSPSSCAVYSTYNVKPQFGNDLYVMDNTTAVAGGGIVRAIVAAGTAMDRYGTISYCDPNVPSGHSPLAKWEYDKVRVTTHQAIWGWVVTKCAPPPPPPPAWNWDNLGGGLHSGTGPGASSRGSSQLDVFVQGTDGALYHRPFDPTNGWQPWDSEGGVLTSDPASVSWANDRIDVVGRSTFGDVVHIAWTADFGWHPWDSLGGGTISGARMGISTRGAGLLDVFVEGTDRQLYQDVWNNGWSGWIALGGPIASGPSSVSWASDRVDVVAIGTAGDIVHRAWTADFGWHPWDSLGGSAASGTAPTISSRGPGLLDVFVTGTDAAVYQDSWNNGWSGWHEIGGPFTSGPSSVSWGPNRIDLFGRGTDGSLVHGWWGN